TQRQRPRGRVLDELDAIEPGWVSRVAELGLGTHAARMIVPTGSYSQARARGGWRSAQRSWRRAVRERSVPGMSTAHRGIEFVVRTSTYMSRVKNGTALWGVRAMWSRHGDSEFTTSRGGD